MPLQKGTSRAVVRQNIREMMASGHPQRQAVAAAMRESGRPRGSGHTRYHLSQTRKDTLPKKGSR
jgi:hypothetical protein